jgi:thiamine-phosphate pyrophosphorylase
MERKEISRLHYLTQDNVEVSHAEQAKAALEAGARWVQLRTKNKSEEEWETIAREVKIVTDSYGAALIINDNPYLALKIRAAGVHLGKNDMPVYEARQLLGPEFIIGATANNKDDLLRAFAQKPDYIGLGPYRFTTTKKNLSPVLDRDMIVELIHLQKEIPVILIGGITLDDLEDIKSLKAHGIAISSAINKALNPQEAARQFVSHFEKTPITI